MRPAPFGFFLLFLLGLVSLFARVGSASPPKSVPDVVRGFGYACEEHNVTTSDGYILTAHRVPPRGAPNQKVVVLQHGLLDSSATWVMNLPNESLAFMLSDAGFDVWMPNSRGNTYGLHHVSLSIQDQEFWNFSWDEMATFDLPASLNYVLNATGVNEISYVGHSQGTMIAFAYFGNASEGTPAFELSQKVNQFVALAPVAYLGDLTAPFLHLLAHVPGLLDKLVLGDKGCFEDTEWIVTRLPVICGIIPEACDDILCLFVGCQSESNYNVTNIPFLMSEYPAGTSVQNLLHYAQGVDTDKFVHFNFPTEKENEQHYNSKTPPAWTLQYYDLPTTMYHGGRDKLADPNDVNLLVSQLPPVPLTVNLIPKFGHGDFVWSLDANQLIYEPVIQQLTALGSK